MPDLVRKALAPFPEPSIIFDVDDRTIVFANPATLFLTEQRSPDLRLQDFDGMKLSDFTDRCGVAWDDGVIGKILDMDVSGPVRSYRDDLRAWVIGSPLAESIENMDLALVSVHARGDEKVATLQHTRLRGIAELALYVADARQDNLMAMRLVQANYERLESLEGSIAKMVDDLGTVMLS